MSRPRKNNPLNLPPFVHEKHGAIYHVRDGVWTRLANNVPDALVALGGILRGATVADASLSMVDMLARAFPVISKGKAPATVGNWKSKLKHLTTALDGVTVAGFKPKAVYTIRRELEDSPSTFNSMLTVLRLSIDWAVEQEIMDINPLESIKLLPANKRDRYLTDAEYAAIYNAGDELTRVVMELCYRTGQRIGDVRRITFDQLTDAGIEFKQGKTDKKVCVGWTPELRDAVARAKALFNETVVRIDRPRFLLAGRGGVALSYDVVQERFATAVAASGVKDARIHDMRAKAATDTDRDTGLAHAQALMGHATSAMTNRYIRDRRANVVTGPTARVKGAA